MDISKSLKIIPKIRNYFTNSTRKGKVEKLEALTRSLTSNTDLVARKYIELSDVEQEVKRHLEVLKEETFEKEMFEIDKLDLIKAEDKEKFKNALVEIKDKGLVELKPISETAQRIKAHMLITLNKAQTQKVILIAKSKLAGNAHLQLETLKTIEHETKDINIELKELLEELDALNADALESVARVKHSSSDIMDGQDESVVDHIVNKMATIKKNKK